jgi:hypothetical protein
VRKARTITLRTADDGKLARIFDDQSAGGAAFEQGVSGGKITGSNLAGAQLLLPELSGKLGFPGDECCDRVGLAWKARTLPTGEHRVGSRGTRETLRRNLLAIDWHVAGGFDSDSDLIAIDFNHSDKNVVTNDDLLA